MELMKERIFGEKRALSATILALQTGTTVQEARHQLQRFYEAHKDKLSAAFLVSQIKANKRVFRIVDAPNESAAQIYALAVANVTDAAVLAELDREKQLLAAGLSSEQLVKTGRILNPLVEGDGPVLTGASSAPSVAAASATNGSSKPESTSTFTNGKTAAPPTAIGSEPPQKKQNLDTAATVDVEMKDETAPAPADESQATAKATLAAPVAAPVAAAPKKAPAKPSKIPPKAGGPKKQASLTSFFSKKK